MKYLLVNMSRFGGFKEDATMHKRLPGLQVRTRATDPKTAKQSIPLDTDATATSESSRPVAEPRSQATASKAGDTGSTAVPPNTLPAAEDAPRTLETTSQARSVFARLNIITIMMHIASV